MTVRDLIEALEEFDDNMEVVIGMKQTYGSDFAMDIEYDVDEYRINAFYGDDSRAVVITESTQCGTVDYDGEDEDED